MVSEAAAPPHILQILKWCAWGALGLAASAWAQHPHGHGTPTNPALIPTLPVTPTWPSDAFKTPAQPGTANLSIEAPGVARDRRELPPFHPGNLAGPQGTIPRDQEVTPTPEDLKRIVAERVRMISNDNLPSEMIQVEVEVVAGGYRITKTYPDRALHPDGTPKAIWQHTYYVGTGDILVNHPPGTPPEPAHPALLPPHGHGGPIHPDLYKLRDIPINLRDPHGLFDPGLDKLRREAKFRDVINRQKWDEAQRENREKHSGPFAEVSLDEVRDIFAAAGVAGLETVLTVGPYVPGIGTVVVGGAAFRDQYYKTRDTLLKHGVDEQEASRRALLQALTVAGVAVGTDLATGAALSKLKGLAKFKQALDGSDKLLQDAVTKGRLTEAGGKLAKVGRDALVDTTITTTATTAATIAGKAVPAIATSLTAGGYTPAVGGRPATQRPVPGGRPYGAYFRLP